MTIITKTSLLKYIGEMPDKFSSEELIERILFLTKIEEGLQQSKNDQIIPDEQVRERIKKWLK